MPLQKKKQEEERKTMRRVSDTVFNRNGVIYNQHLAHKKRYCITSPPQNDPKTCIVVNTGSPQKTSLTINQDLLVYGVLYESFTPQITGSNKKKRPSETNCPKQ